MIHKCLRCRGEVNQASRQALAQAQAHGARWLIHTRAGITEEHWTAPSGLTACGVRMVMQGRDCY